MLLEQKILTILNEVLGQTVRLRKGGTQAVYFCPKCNHVKRKLEICISGSAIGCYACWVCHFKGRSFGSLLNKLKAPRRYRDELFILTKDVRLQRRNRIKTISDDLTLPEEFISLASPPKSDPLRPQQIREYRAAAEFLKKRDVGIIDICRYNIGYCTEGEYKDCVVVPSYDDDGKLNYFSARHYYPHKYLKYQNAPFSKNIIGFECFIDFDSDFGITMVEGVFDAIAIRNNAIPLFGTYPSQKLLESIIIHKVKRVNICLDSDAVDESVKIYDLLKTWSVPEIHLIVLPEKDPSLIGFNKMHDIIVNSQPTKMHDIIKIRLAL